MNFERHTDVKSAIGIGREQTALKIYGLDILLAGDDRVWTKFRANNGPALHSILKMIGKKEVSKEELLKYVTNQLNQEQDLGFTKNLTQVKFELKYNQSDVAKLRENGVTSFNTIKYQLLFYAVYEGRQILV